MKRMSILQACYAVCKDVKSWVKGDSRELSLRILAKDIFLTLALGGVMLAISYTASGLLSPLETDWEVVAGWSLVVSIICGFVSMVIGKMGE